MSADFKQEGEVQIPVKQETKSIRLSTYATHNAFHHCEQCHHYCEAGPATQVSEAYTLNVTPMDYTFILICQTASTLERVFILGVNA